MAHTPPSTYNKLNTLIHVLTRMTTFIKTKFKKSDIQTNIDKNRVPAEYHILSKLIFLRIIILKFMKKGQIFYVKNVCKNVKNELV